MPQQGPLGGEKIWCTLLGHALHPGREHSGTDNADGAGVKKEAFKKKKNP